MKKYKPVKSCANCLMKTEDCKCSVRLVGVVEKCEHCKQWVDEEWNFCPTCGYEIGVEIKEMK